MILEKGSEGQSKCESGDDKRSKIKYVDEIEIEIANGQIKRQNTN